MNGSVPKLPIIVPPSFDKATTDVLAAANPGCALLILGTASPVPAEAPAEHHREVVSSWCDTVDDVLKYGGDLAKLVVPPAAVTLVVGILRLGTARVREALLKEPTRERWPVAMLEAEPPAARPLP